MLTPSVNSSGLIRYLAKIENNRATKNVSEPNFTLYYPVSLRVLLGLSAVVFLVFSVLCVLFIEEEEGKIIGGSFFGLFFLVSLICLMYYRHWKLKFDQYGLVYTPGFGAERELRYSQIEGISSVGGNLLLKTEEASIRIPSYAIGLPVFLCRLERERFEIVAKKSTKGI